mgnify:CR=1 FL=1
MTIELKVASDRDAEKWDNIVETSPHGTIFHKWNWLKIAEKYTKSKLYPIIGYKGDSPIGIFPLFYFRKYYTKMIFSPPPRVLMLYLGPLITSNKNYSKIERIFINFNEKVNEFITHKLSCNYIRIRTSPGLVDSRPFIWAGYEVEPLYTYIINLTKGIEQIWSGLKKELRKNITKAQKEGVKVEEGFKEDLYFIESLLAKRFEEQGFHSGSPHYRNYLSELYEIFHPHHLRIFVAKYRNEIITGQIVVCHKDKLSLWTGSPKTSILRGSPNDLLQWEIIKWAHKHGFKYCEIMDAGDNPRLRHFKAKFNPELFVWFSAVKYSSPIFKMLEKLAKTIYRSRSIVVD